METICVVRQKTDRQPNLTFQIVNCDFVNFFKIIIFIKLTQILHFFDKIKTDF